MGTDPYANKEHGGDPQSALDIFKQVIRATGGVVGVVAMMVGLVYGVKMLKLVFNLLSRPEEADVVLHLAQLLGGADLVLPSAHGTIPFATPLAVALLIAGLLLVGWLSLGLIQAGAKVLAFCLTDRESIKELLSYALGQKKKPEDNKDKKPIPR